MAVIGFGDVACWNRSDTRILLASLLIKADLAFCRKWSDEIIENAQFTPIRLLTIRGISPAKSIRLDVHQSALNCHSAAKPPQQGDKAGDEFKLELRSRAIIGIYRRLQYRVIGRVLKDINTR
jgi:hypothetical protein